MNQRERRDLRRQIVPVLYRRGWTIARIASRLRVTDRTVCRDIAATIPPAERVGKGGRAQRRVGHGASMYTHHKCRCAVCRAANLERQRRLIGREPPTHGASGYMNYRCRCEVCRAAGSEVNRRWKERLGAR